MMNLIFPGVLHFYTTRKWKPFDCWGEFRMSDLLRFAGVVLPLN